MILADTSVWVDHLRAGDALLATLLTRGDVVLHPLVVAEIALGALRDRDKVLRLLDGMAATPQADVAEVHLLIERQRLHGRGIGFVDAALLASCRIAPGVKLWTRDRRLDEAARALGVRYDGPSQ